VKNFNRWLFGALVGALLLAACVPAAAPAQDPKALIETIAAATIAALPTNTPYPTATASFTRDPAFTALPDASNITTVPTLTPFPTLTPWPTLPLPSTLASNPINGSGNYILYTATPETWKCDMRHLSPAQGTTYAPRNGFRAEWRIFNIGGKIWKTDSVRVKYLGGTSMQNDPAQRNEFFIPDAIYPGDKILVHIAMTSPKEPGEYSSFWGLVNDKDQVFCTFGMMIHVQNKN